MNGVSHSGNRVYVVAMHWMEWLDLGTMSGLVCIHTKPSVSFSSGVVVCSHEDRSKISLHLNLARLHETKTILSASYIGQLHREGKVTGGGSGLANAAVATVKFLVAL